MKGNWVICSINILFSIQILIVFTICIKLYQKRLLNIALVLFSARNIVKGVAKERKSPCPVLLIPGQVSDPVNSIKIAAESGESIVEAHG